MLDDEKDQASRTSLVNAFYLLSIRDVKTAIFFTATLYLQDITLIHQIGVNKVKNISQPHMDHDFVTFQHYMPRLSVYQMSPQLPVFFTQQQMKKGKALFLRLFGLHPLAHRPAPDESPH